MEQKKVRSVDDILNGSWDEPKEPVPVVLCVDVCRRCRKRRRGCVTLPNGKVFCPLLHRWVKSGDVAPNDCYLLTEHVILGGRNAE